MNKYTISRMSGLGLLKTPLTSRSYLDKYSSNETIIIELNNINTKINFQISASFTAVLDFSQISIDSVMKFGIKSQRAQGEMVGRQIAREPDNVVPFKKIVQHT